ncbi:MAG: hypothetical protein U0941_29840 [Planctomycetaceae bacterium]
MIAATSQQVNRLPAGFATNGSSHRHLCESLPPARIADCTASEYLFWCETAIARNAPIPNWETKEQYLAALDAYPDRVSLVAPADHVAMGLPANFGRVVPFTPEWQERFLCTLATDDEFRAAVRSLLGGQ